MSTEKETNVEELKQAITYYNVASMHVQHKQIKRAISYYNKAIDELNFKGITQHKFHVILLENLAEAYGMLEEYEISASYYFKTIEMSLIVDKDPKKCVNISFLLADTLDKIGRTEEAFMCLCKTYEVVVGVDEDDVDLEEENMVFEKLMFLRAKIEGHPIN